MNYFSVLSRRVPAAELSPDSGELAARMLAGRGFSNEITAECEKLLVKAADCRFAYVRVPVKLSEDDLCTLGFISTNSSSLFRNLTGCDTAFILAVTLGAEVDRLISRLSVSSKAKGFITDALASTYAEALCDFAENEICAELDTRPRFSPGYGDLSLDIQPEILELLNAGRLLGITLNKSLLMSPLKSVTAIIGCKKK